MIQRVDSTIKGAHQLCKEVRALAEEVRIECERCRVLRLETRILMEVLDERGRRRCELEGLPKLSSHE